MMARECSRAAALETRTCRRRSRARSRWAVGLTHDVGAGHLGRVQHLDQLLIAGHGAVLRAGQQGGRAGMPSGSGAHQPSRSRPQAAPTAIPKLTHFQLPPTMNLRAGMVRRVGLGVCEEGGAAGRAPAAAGSMRCECGAMERGRLRPMVRGWHEGGAARSGGSRHVASPPVDGPRIPAVFPPSPAAA